MQFEDEEVKKLLTVSQEAKECKGTLSKLLCENCKSILLKINHPPQGSIITKKDANTIKRLPYECQRVINDLEVLLVKKEKLNKGGEDDEEYGTTEEWYEQTIYNLSVQHEREVEELQRELDHLKRETNDTKRREQELIDQHERKIAEHQKITDSFKISIETKDQTIENIETDRIRDRQRIKSLEDVIKILDKRVIELSHPNPQGKSTKAELCQPSQEKSTQTELSQHSQGKSTQTEHNQPSEGKSTQTDLCQRRKSTQTDQQYMTEKKSSSWNFFGPSKDQLNAERMENENVRLNFQKKLQEKEEMEKRLRERSKELSRALSQMGQSCNDKTQHITNLNAKVAELDMKNEKLHSELQSALDKERQREANLQEKNTELASVQSRMDKIQKENTTLIGDKQKTTEECQRKEKQLDDSHQEIQQLLHNKNEQEKDLKTLRAQLEQMQLPRKKTIVMGLHCNRSGIGKTLIEMIVTELTKDVQDRLDRKNINLTIQFSQTPSKVTSWLQFVLCLNMSRVGTNILDSVKGMKGDRDVYVLVLHHTSGNNLSSLTPTSHRVTGSELRQLGGILDIAFCSDGGLYECDFNNNTFDKIVSLLRKHIVL